MPDPIVWADEPLKVAEPDDAVNVPALLKAPAIEKVAVEEIVAPLLMVKLYSEILLPESEAVLPI